MSKQIIIKKNALSTEMAVLLNDEFISYYVESNTETNWQNCIVVGQVQQIVKNLNAVFIDFGENKNGMLHFKQIPEDYLKQIKQGYTLPVQITKQNEGAKGNKLTAKLNLTGKHLICLPFESGVYFSKKITQQPFKKAVKEVLEALEYGFIVRTHAIYIPIDEIIQDARNLIDTAHHLIEQGQYMTKGNILYEEQSSIFQMLIEQLIKQEPLEIICNTRETENEIQRLIKDYGKPDSVSLKCLENEKNLFSIYSLSKKIDQLTQRKIWLKNGGNLIIDYTEAMTVIDVNSAKAILTKNAEKAVLELNKEATKEAILQILRRNLSGMILVDLVEMKNPENATTIYQYAKQLLKAYDEGSTQVYPLTELGLLQFARTKKYHSIPHQLLSYCPKCQTNHSQESFLAKLMQLEKQLQNVTLQEGQQPVYLKVSSAYYKKIMSEHLIERLEAVYPIKIEIEKERMLENQVICQFYQ